MCNIFFDKLSVANYKCFLNQEFEFGVPDGVNAGSGLNIFIGENGNGKTAVLELLNYLTQSTYATENRLKIGDFNDPHKEIVVIAETDEFNCKMPFPNNYFECNGITFTAKSRERKSPGKLLSSPFQISNAFKNMHTNYKNSKSEDSRKEVQGLYKIFNNENIIDGSINVFYFDKNRTRQISNGTYKTTFEKICDDLNWKFVNSLNSKNKEALIQNVNGEYFKSVLDATQKGTGQKLASEMKDFFEKDEYENIKIELLDLLHPFSNAFFALKNDDDLKQIQVRDLGSGIEMILTLLLLKNISNESKGSVVYLIDEPELHLHPKAQESLLEILLLESKDKQIFLSTHSPYLFKNCLSYKTHLYIFGRNEQNEIDISNARDADWKIFPWSPSWGVINFQAYDLPTIEFHNELYGYAQELTGLQNTDQFDQRLIQLDNSMPIKTGYTHTNGSSFDCSLCTYIRHQIHHPENTNNSKFTPEELKQSINLLTGVLKLLNSPVSNAV